MKLTAIGIEIAIENVIEIVIEMVKVNCALTKVIVVQELNRVVTKVENLNLGAG